MKFFEPDGDSPSSQVQRAVWERKRVVSKTYNGPEFVFCHFQHDHVVFCLIISLGKKTLSLFAYPQCNQREPSLTIFKGFSFLKFVLRQTYTGIARAKDENGAPHGDIFIRRSELEVSFLGALLQHAMDVFCREAASEYS